MTHNAAPSALAEPQSSDLLFKGLQFFEIFQVQEIFVTPRRFLHGNQTVKIGKPDRHTLNGAFDTGIPNGLEITNARDKRMKVALHNISTSQHFGGEQLFDREGSHIIAEFSHSEFCLGGIFNGRLDKNIEIQGGTDITMGRKRHRPDDHEFNPVVV